MKNYIIAIGISFLIGGTGSFFIFAFPAKKSNREIKKEIKSIKDSFKLSELKVDSLNNVINKRDELDNIRNIRLDSLKTKLEKLNNKNIITTHDTYTTVTNLNLSGDIKFLSGFVDSSAISR